MLNLQKTSIVAILGALALAATPVAQAKVDAFAAKNDEATAGSTQPSQGVLADGRRWQAVAASYAALPATAEATSEHSPVVVSPSGTPQAFAPTNGDAINWGDIAIAAGLAGFLAVLLGISLGSSVSRRRLAHT